MGLKEILPFQQAPTRKEVQLLPADTKKALARLFRVAGVAVGYSGSYTSFYNDRSTFERPDYDFSRISKAIDTDSYVKQSFLKYKELIWKEGWDIVGENPDAIDYLYNRIDFIEEVLGKPFDSFLVDLVDQLTKFHNAFVVKVRGEVNSFFNGYLQAPEGKDPILGYYLLPTELIDIERDRFNRPIRYRQRISDTVLSASKGQREPVWKAEDVIHFTIDKRPGHAFGVPFMSAVMDDVVALRQLEEDIQNLVHRELFPLYKYKVGTDEHPADPEEMDAAADELAGLRQEGGLVISERHDIEVVGSEGEALDATGYLAHFKERVALGLGLSPHHLGMTMNGGNRAMSDRLDTALYDKAKSYQRYASQMIQLHILNELLVEGGFNPYVNPYGEGISDRCEFRFREIDADTQIKKENHVTQLFLNNLITMEEARLLLNKNPDIDEDQTYSALAKRQKDPAASLPSPQSKAVDNKSRPANQYGRKNSPNIRRNSQTPMVSVEWAEDVLDILGDDD